jgi:hypothetical protein
MVWSAVENQQDILPGEASRQCVEEALEERGVRCRHDQVDASAVLRADRAIKIDVLTNELRGDLGSDPARRPAGPWAIDPPEPCFVGEHNPQSPPAAGSPSPGQGYGAWETASLNWC